MQFCGKSDLTIDIQVHTREMWNNDMKLKKNQMQLLGLTMNGRTA